MNLEDGDLIIIGSYHAIVTMARLGRPSLSSVGRGTDPAAWLPPEARVMLSPPSGKPSPPREPTVLLQPTQTIALNEVSSGIAQVFGLAASDLTTTDPGQLARELAQLVVLTITELRRTLQASDEFRQHASTPPLAPNPIATLGTAEALMALFTRGKPGYLDASRALRQSFLDLREAQNRSEAAALSAAALFAEALQPQQPADKPSGLSVFRFGRRSKSKLWDACITRWLKLTGGTPEGASELFQRLYSLERAKRTRRGSRPFETTGRAPNDRAPA